MSTIAHQALIPDAAIVSPAQALDRALRDASPAEVIETALKTVGREHLALVSSFGTESAALLKVMADVDPAIPVVFLDTGWLFEETLAYRDTLIATLGLTDVRSIKPLEETLSREDPERELWFSDPDACCRIRKVEPLARALKPFSAWINGRKRFQGGARAENPSRRGRRREIEVQPVRQCFPRGDRGDLQEWQNCRRIRWSPRAICRSAACRARAGRRPVKMRGRAAGAARPRENAASIRRRLLRTTPIAVPQTMKCGFVD